jgi:hypothetical protein
MADFLLEKPDMLISDLSPEEQQVLKNILEAGQTADPYFHYNVGKELNLPCYEKFHPYCAAVFGLIPDTEYMRYLNTMRRFESYARNQPNDTKIDPSDDLIDYLNYLATVSKEATNGAAEQAYNIAMSIAKSRK